MLLVGLLAGSVVIPAACPQADQAMGKPEETPPLATSPSAASTGRPLSAFAMPPKAMRYYQATWGVDILA